MKFRQALFWDVDPKTIDTKKHAQYVIERIMDLGKDNEVRWMWSFYTKRKIKNVLIKSRSLRPETKNLWTLLLK